jgi:hypothetical protein
VRTTRFWNNLHHLRSKQTELKVFGRRNIKGPNPISFTIYGLEHITCFTQIHIFHIFISSQVICSRHDAAEKLFISAIKLQTLTRVFCRVRMSLKKIGEKHQINTDCQPTNHCSYYLVLGV